MKSADDRREQDRGVDPIQRHVGDRLRLARKALRISQEGLAEQLGVTFQQVQKYEKGVNRISATRLHHAAAVLKVPVSYFFPEADATAEQPAGESSSLPQTVLECLDTREGMELILAFSRIADPKVRRHVLELVSSVAGKSIT
jgi:transcriptional regulator with XRE-family HTH domain